jgi:hypothetical protein
LSFLGTVGYVVIAPFTQHLALLLQQDVHIQDTGDAACGITGNNERERLYLCLIPHIHLLAHLHVFATRTSINPQYDWELSLGMIGM